MPATNPPYPPESRREAIRLVRSAPEERSISRTAKELGISAKLLPVSQGLSRSLEWDTGAVFWQRRRAGELENQGGIDDRPAG